MEENTITHMYLFSQMLFLTLNIFFGIVYCKIHVRAASEYLSREVSVPTLMSGKTIGIIVLHTCNKCQVWKTNK